MAVVISSTGIVQAVVPLTTSNTVVAPLSGIAGQLPLRHNQLVSRGAEDAHPMSAITGLEEALDLAAGGVFDVPPAGPLQGNNGGAGFTLLESAMLPDLLTNVDGGPTLLSIDFYWIEVELRCLDVGSGRPVVKLTFESENEVELVGVWEKVTRYNTVDYWIGGSGAEGDHVVYVGLDSENDPGEQVGFLPESGTVVFRFSLNEYIQDPRCLIETSNLDGSGELVEVSRIRAGLRANYQW